MIPEATLSLILNDGRDYVQGTQILGRTSEFLLPHGALSLTSAAFHRISDHSVTLISAQEFFGDTARLLGKASFSAADAQSIEVVFVEEDGRAPVSARPENCDYEMIEQTGDLDARFRLSQISNIEDFLVGLVQSVKGLHANLGPDVHDIWFTGLRRTNLQIGDGQIPATGFLALSEMRRLPSPGGTQTMISFQYETVTSEMKATHSIENDVQHAGVVSGVITFVYKSERG